MTHARIDDTLFRLNGDDPREVLAALSAAFHEVPEHSIVVAGVETAGAVATLARIRWGDEPIFGALTTAASLIRDAAHSSGLPVVLVAVIGRISPSVSPTVEPVPNTDAESDKIPAQLAEWLIDMVRDRCLSTALFAYYFSGQTAGMMPTPSGEHHEWDEYVIGSVHDSIFAAHEVSAGRRFSLVGGERHFVDDDMLGRIEKRWAPASGTKETTSTTHGKAGTTHRDARAAVDALIRAGAGESGWLTEGSGSVAKCELFESLVLTAESREGRDQVLLEQVRVLEPEVRDLDTALSRLLGAPDVYPGESIRPGGTLYFVARLPAAVLRALRDADIRPDFERGLINLACNYALLAWWSGRCSESGSTVEAILARDPYNEMAGYIARLLGEGILPPWLERQQSVHSRIGDEGIGGRSSGAWAA